MSKLILWNLVTLDGYFEGPASWDLGFHQYAVDEEFHRFSAEMLRSAEMLLFGRVTYEGMAAYWPTASDEIAGRMNSIPKAVFSRTLAAADWRNTTLVKDDPATYVSNLKLQGTLNIFVFGSADLSAYLIDAGLFDEYWICVVPMILGQGKPLFAAGVERTKLKLLESRTLGSGSVILRYRREG